MPELSCPFCHRDFKKHSLLIKHQTRDKPQCILNIDEYATNTEAQRLDFERLIKNHLKSRKEHITIRRNPNLSADKLAKKVLGKLTEKDIIYQLL